MSTPPTANAPLIAVDTSPADERPPSPKPAVVSPGVGSGDSSLAPAPSSTKTVLAAAASSSANGPAPQVEAPAAVPTASSSSVNIPAPQVDAVAKRTIQIETKRWFGHSVEEVTLDTALTKKWITPQQAVEKGYCTAAYLTTKGFDNVRFIFAGLFGREVTYEGTLKKALKHGYITIEKAIERNFITREQAIEGGFLKG